MCVDFVTIVHDFHKCWFSKRRSLTSANPTFSLLWTCFRYFEHISRFFKQLYDILLYLWHVRGFCSYVPHIVTIIWSPNDYPLHHNHSFSLFCIFSYIMLLFALYQTFMLHVIYICVYWTRLKYKNIHINIHKSNFCL